MAAGVTINHKAFSDERIVALGERAGYNQHEALGRMARLWSLCTELQTDTPPIARIRACLGPHGDVALVDVGLGEVMSDGMIRVRGCEGRTEWYAERASQQAAAGRARAAGAVRDAGGRLQRAGTSATSALVQRSQPAGPALQPETSGQPASEQEYDPDGLSVLVPNPPEPPDSGTREIADKTRARAYVAPTSPPRTAPAPAPAPRQPEDQVLAAIARAHSTAPSQNAPPAPAQAFPVERPPRKPLQLAPGALVPDPAVIARRKLVERFPRELNAARAKVAAELGLPAADARPVAIMGGENETELMNRLRESADPEGDMLHVIAVAAADARRTRSLKWLGWTLARSGAWATKLAGTVAEAKAGPTDPRAPAQPPPRPRPRVERGPRPLERTPEELAELQRMASGVVAAINGRTAPIKAGDG